MTDNVDLWIFRMTGEQRIIFFAISIRIAAEIGFYSPEHFFFC